MSILNITVIEKSESRRLKWLVETLVQGEWWYAITQPRILSFAHKVLTARRVKAEVALKGRVRFAYAHHDYPQHARTKFRTIQKCFKAFTTRVNAITLTSNFLYCVSIKIKDQKSNCATKINPTSIIYISIIRNSENTSVSINILFGFTFEVLNCSDYTRKWNKKHGFREIPIDLKSRTWFWAHKFDGDTPQFDSRSRCSSV